MVCTSITLFFFRGSRSMTRTTHTCVRRRPSTPVQASPLLGPIAKHLVGILRC